MEKGLFSTAHSSGPAQTATARSPFSLTRARPPHGPAQLAVGLGQRCQPAKPGTLALFSSAVADERAPRCHSLPPAFPRLTGWKTEQRRGNKSTQTVREDSPRPLLVALRAKTPSQPHTLATHPPCPTIIPPARMAPPWPTATTAFDTKPG
jgi:hypothetical protein